MLYFIQEETSCCVKIGHAGDPAARLGELQIGSPARLVLLLVLPDGPAEEAGMHRCFAEYRHNGEWFRPGPRLVEFLASCLPEYDVEGTYRLRDGYRVQKKHAQRLHAVQDLHIAEETLARAAEAVRRKREELQRLTPYWPVGVSKADAVAAWREANPPAD